VEKDAMDAEFPIDLLDDPVELARFDGWSEAVYRDFLALQRGRISEDDFRAAHGRRRAILALDLTGFTITGLQWGELDALLRIFNAQKVCIPVLRATGACHIRCFADDIVALFERPEAALDAALTIHDRIAAFNATPLAGEHPAQCCIGIGWGHVLAIGPNLAQGDEMNLASKLGEDTARGGETLVTENAQQALRERPDVRFERRVRDDAVFSYYEVIRRSPAE
jgi:class 3 adenylate cyclase